MNSNENMISKIFEKIKKDSASVTAYEDLFAFCRNIEQNDFALAHETNAKLRREVSAAIKRRYDVESFFDLYKKTLLFDAPHYFDSYLLYLEINRKPHERFYQPRRAKLKKIVDEFQRLADDDLDELFVSEPPRVGDNH